MQRISFTLSSMFMILCVFSLCAAQDPAMSPPDVLLIVREEIKPGKGPAHIEESFRYIQALRKAKSHWGRIGMTPVAGDENEVLYFWPYSSFAEVEKANREMAAWAAGPLKADFDNIAQGPEDLHVSQSAILAIYRPDLSYRPEVNIAEMRYMVIGKLKVHPGKQSAFEAASKIYTDALKKSNRSTPSAVFQVLAGSDAGMFLVVSPLKSLAELDKLPTEMKAFGEALGPDGMAKIEKAAGEIFQSMSNSIYAFNPRMSYVSDDFAARDKTSPGFWNPKQ